MKTELVSARLSKEDTEILREVTTDEKTDKTTALRKVLSLGARQYRLEKAIKQYQAGRIGAARAAEMAHTSLWGMMEELKTRNIPSNLGREDYKQGLRNLKKATTL